MLRINPVRTSLAITLTYKRPILDWQGIPSRFFEFIYDTMTPQYAVSTSQLSLTNVLVLGQAAVKYNIFGGNSSVTITPDRFEFDFPVVQDSDRDLVSDILKKFHDGLPVAFPECDYQAIDLRDSAHVDFRNATSDKVTEIETKRAVSDYLDRYKISDVTAAFEGLGDFEQTSFGRYEVKALDRSWWCRASVEKSLFIPNGLFVELFVRIEGEKVTTSFEDKQELVQVLQTTCLKALGIDNS